MEGEEIVTITGNGLTSAQLLEIFDTPSHRILVSDRSGRTVDNVSEEYSRED